MKTTLAYLLIFAILFLTPCSASSFSIKMPEQIKVALAENAQEIELAIKGPYRIIDDRTGKVFKEDSVLWQAKFSAKGKQRKHFNKLSCN